MNRVTRANMICILFATFGAQTTYAADIPQPVGYRPYVTLFGGADLLPGISATDGFFGSGKLYGKPGDIVGIIVGMNVKSDLRVEAELSRSFNGIDNFTFNNGNKNTYQGGGINQTFALANVWYDFHNQSAFVPYIGGGLGVGWADGNIDLGSGNFVNATAPVALAFQLGVGVNYEINDKFSLDLGYRFKGITGLNPTVTTDGIFPDQLDQNTVAAHYFQVGATLRF